MELSRKGISKQGKPLFQFPDVYSQTASLPYLKITFLEALASAYEAAKRPDDALKNWQDMYEAPAASGFAAARAESANKLANLYKDKKEITKSIEFYALAAEASATAGNEQSQVGALASEATLLSQQGEKEKALRIEEELLLLANASKNVRLQFFVNLAIAEVLDGTGRVDRVERALKDAESLVSSDGTTPGVEPNSLVELYGRLADLQEKRKDVRQELIALEKAVTPALVLANAPGDKKNGKPWATLMPKLEVRITQEHVRDTAEKTYSVGNFADALVYFELLQYFEEIDAAWKGKYEEYTKNLGTDPTIGKLRQIPYKVISQDGGATILAKNIEDMGPHRR
jgi:tetratricopeptide (TPR) repeat protein